MSFETTVNKYYEIAFSEGQTFILLEASDDGSITNVTVTIPLLFGTFTKIKLNPKLETLETLRNGLIEVLASYYEIFGGAK